MERQPAAASALDNGQHRRSSAGSHVATRSSDKRLRANKTGPRQTTAGRAKELDEMLAWARGRVAQAATVIRAYKARLTCGHVPQSSPAVDEANFVPRAEGTDLAANLAPLGGPAEVDDVLEEEDFDPIAAYLLG